MLTYDDDAHRYYWNCQPVPNVTSILQPLYEDAFRFVAPDVLARKAALGKAVHRATELIDADDLDDDSIDEALMPYLRAYKKFLADTGFEATATELRVFHPIHRYAGTLDRIGILHKLNGERSLVDYKTVAAISPATAVQTAAYAEAWRRMDPAHAGQLVTRRALQLKPDGTYRLTEPYTSAADMATFLSLLSINNWKVKNHE